MFEPPQLAERIKAVMKTKKVGTLEMLESCGLSKNALTTMVNGSVPKADSLAKIADYLDVSIDYLLGRNEGSALSDVKISHISNDNIQIENNIHVQPAKIIKSILDTRGITPAKMSKDLGFSSGSFTQWTQGRSNISLEALGKIATYLHVSTDYLLGRTNNPILQDESIAYISPEEFALIEKFRTLEPDKQKAIKTLLS